MKKILIIQALLYCLFFTSYSQLAISGLLTENLENPVGIDIPKPRFTWQLKENSRNVMQQAYEIRLYLREQMVWESGRTESSQSVQVPYTGQALVGGKKYSWVVKVWDNKGVVSAWSSPAFFITAVLDPSEWQAKWIQPGFEEDNIMRPSPIFRKEFVIQKKILSAIAYITAHGMYEAHINGKRVGDAYLTPGWTSYNKRLEYQTYDVTNILKNGNNTIAVCLGNGWYRGIIGFSNRMNVYGKDISLLFQLELTYNDGSKEVVASDGTWKSSTGSIRYSEIYNGETIDAQLEKTGWLLPGYNDREWNGVKLSEFPVGRLLATRNEPVKKHEIFRPARIITTPQGERVIDFGQNLVGWVVMKVSGKKGDSIRISHAEVLDKKGNFYTANLRAAKEQDTYILSGKGEEIFQPHFTWQGFRFARIEGYPGELKPENFEAVVLYSDMTPTGTFTTSNERINQLQHNIQWGQKGNFLDVPTDCPQRDERLGWTGDAQAFSRTASFNMNVNSFFAKWLKDLQLDQDEGVVPFVIPNVLGKPVSSAGWADVATIVPWNMYLAYGDRRLLDDQYPSMKEYVESIRKIAVNDLWNTGFHFGDWLFYRPDDDNDGRAAVTDKYLIAQCFYAHSAELLSDAARVLGKNEDAALYSGLVKKIKDAFLKEYVTPNGHLVSGTQTAYVLALNFDMLPENIRPQAAERLVANIKSYRNHLTTGFLGTPYLCHVLSRFGYSEIAYTLLLQDTYPSWLYPLKMGATTIWERWDGIKPDSSFQTPSMNSYNHYAYGAIGDWMYRVMAGLDTEEDGPGYKHIRIKPHPGGGFSYVSATMKTYYGTITTGWKTENGKMIMDVNIPANTIANIYIPAGSAGDVSESGISLAASKDIKILNKEEGYKEEGYIIVQTGSGSYHFISTWKEANQNK